MTPINVLKSAIYREGKREIAISLKSQAYTKVRAAIFSFTTNYPNYDPAIEKVFIEALKADNPKLSDTERMEQVCLGVQVDIKPLQVEFHDLAVEFVGDCYNRISPQLWEELDSIKNQTFKAQTLNMKESLDHYMKAAIYSVCNEGLW